MNKNRFPRVLIIAGGLALSSIAFAGDTRMDADGDGVVSAAEHAAGAKAMFDRMDASKDGHVTSAEMDASHKAVAKDGNANHAMFSAEKIKAVDTDGDGAISADEHSAGSQRMFEKMDADKDGSVSKAEMEAGHKALMSK